MIRFLSAPAAMLLAALAVSTAASAQVTSLPLALPPAGGNAASSTIFDAMLAIARATGSNPTAAQQATFAYAAAIQQYNAGDYARSRMSALQAISATSNDPAARATAMPPGATAAAAQQYAKQQQAQHTASPASATMGGYAPLPLATLGPDPALQQTPVPAVMPSTRPEPATRRGFRL